MFSISLRLLKSCESGFPCMLIDLFMFLKESYFPDCCKVSFMVPLFKIVGYRPLAKNYRPISVISTTNKIFEKPVNIMHINHVEKCNLSTDFHYDLNTSISTVDLSAT